MPQLHRSRPRRKSFGLLRIPPRWSNWFARSPIGRCLRLGIGRVGPYTLIQETRVENLFARSVFFVKDTECSLRFYTNTLGFKLDWNHQEQGRACVFQVSLFGFQLILNQTEAEARTENRP